MIRDKTAIVGLGATPYYRRGASVPQTLEELVGKSILAAVHDAGLRVADVDGFAYFAGGFDTALLAETLGIPEVRFSATLTGTGGGSAGAIGLASAAIVSGQAEVVVCVGANQQGAQRFGSITAAYPATPENAFFSASGLVGPGHMFALLVRHDAGGFRRGCFVNACQRGEQPECDDATAHVAGRLLQGTDACRSALFVRLLSGN